MAHSLCKLLALAHQSPQLEPLSSAINDPTTAVLAIDQIKRLLRAVGGGICTMT